MPTVACHSSYISVQGEHDENTIGVYKPRINAAKTQDCGVYSSAAFIRGRRLMVFCLSMQFIRGRRLLEGSVYSNNYGIRE